MNVPVSAVFLHFHTPAFSAENDCEKQAVFIFTQVPLSAAHMQKFICVSADIFVCHWHNRGYAVGIMVRRSNNSGHTLTARMGCGAAWHALCYARTRKAKPMPTRSARRAGMLRATRARVYVRGHRQMPASALSWPATRVCVAQASYPSLPLCGACQRVI